MPAIPFSLVAAFRLLLLFARRSSLVAACHASLLHVGLFPDGEGQAVYPLVLDEYDKVISL